MTDCEIISLMMPNALPNCTKNPERNPRVHRARAGESVHGEFSGNRTEIIVWDCNDPAIAHRSGNEMAPTTTTINSVSPDDEINDGDTTCIENSMGLIASTSNSQQQQEMFAHHVLDSHNLHVIELTSENDVINSYYSIGNDEEFDETRLETISEESINSIPVRISIYRQPQPLFAFSMLDNHNLDVIDLTSEDDDINSHYSIENDEEVYTFSVLDNHINLIDLTSEDDDDDDTNSYYSIEHDYE